MGLIALRNDQSLWLAEQKLKLGLLLQEHELQLRDQLIYGIPTFCSVLWFLVTPLDSTLF